jgi:hypothetical protein
VAQQQTPQQRGQEPAQAAVTSALGEGVEASRVACGSLPGGREAGGAAQAAGFGALVPVGAHGPNGGEQGSGADSSGTSDREAATAGPCAASCAPAPPGAVAPSLMAALLAAVAPLGLGSEALAALELDVACAHSQGARSGGSEGGRQGGLPAAAPAAAAVAASAPTQAHDAASTRSQHAGALLHRHLRWSASPCCCCCCGHRKQLSL